jgi:hypothetical protein
VKGATALVIQEHTRTFAVAESFEDFRNGQVIRPTSLASEKVGAESNREFSPRALREFSHRAEEIGEVAAHFGKANRTVKPEPSIASEFSD